MPHATTTHPLTIRALQTTESGFLSLPLPFSPTELGFQSLPLLPPLVLNRMSLGSPFCSQVSHFQQIYTQALRKNHNPSSTVCQHTPVPPFPHPQLPQFCKSQLTRDPPPPSFLHANFMTMGE